MRYWIDKSTIGESRDYNPNFFFLQMTYKLFKNKIIKHFQTILICDNQFISSVCEVKHSQEK